MHGSIGNTAVRSEHGLGLDQIRQYAPSVFAEQPHDRVSSRYGFVPTISVVEELGKTGLVPVYAGQSITRDKSRKAFTRHVLRFRPDMAPELHGTVPEVVLMNSHDGSSGFKLWLGMFRMVCANGMIISDNLLGQINVPHRSQAPKLVADQSIGFLSKIDYVDDKLRLFMDKILTVEEQYDFAAKAADIRWGQDKPAGLNSRSLLDSRRYGDDGDDAWRVLNRVQENVIKGGVSLLRANRRSSTRVMRSVSDDARINTQLWETMDAVVA